MAGNPNQQGATAQSIASPGFGFNNVYTPAQTALFNFQQTGMAPDITALVGSVKNSLSAPQAAFNSVPFTSTGPTMGPMTGTPTPITQGASSKR